MSGFVLCDCPVLLFHRHFFSSSVFRLFLEVSVYLNVSELISLLRKAVVISTDSSNRRVAFHVVVSITVLARLGRRIIEYNFIDFLGKRASCSAKSHGFVLLGQKEEVVTTPCTRTSVCVFSTYVGASEPLNRADVSRMIALTADRGARSCAFVVTTLHMWRISYAYIVEGLSG